MTANVVKPAHAATTLDAATVVADYRLGYRSRQASLLGRREVLTGKAKFGIFGDGKEVAQLAMAHAFRKGDIRSGYYRDQTFMLAIGGLTLQQFFAQLYAHAHPAHDPASRGRQMNGHFGTPFLDEEGQWLNLAERYNSVADASPTASQMPRLVGLAQASKLYRTVPALAQLNHFSYNGNEIAWGTIGDASTSEGLFWESINASGVLQVPLLMSVWDDGYGISVPVEHQTTRASISQALAGMQAPEGQPGLDIYVVRGWDYLSLLDTYQRAAYRVRAEHRPALVHVVEVTQPQGHSTSGSHERYKTPERLAWEREHDCLLHLRRLILTQNLAREDELNQWEEEDRQAVQQARKTAWDAYRGEINDEAGEALRYLADLARSTAEPEVLAAQEELQKHTEPLRRDIYVAVHRAMRATRHLATNDDRLELQEWKHRNDSLNYERYSSQLYAENDRSAALVPPQIATYPHNPKQVDGREVLQACFDALLERDPRVLAFGEDVGRLGDVNQAFAGLQEKYGVARVADTGIREATIVGQGIGLALRGLRPIAEIQYLDYLLYALQILSDDVATLRYRSGGSQQVPLIVRTRGHRLEGIWHSGSPMQALLGTLRGMYLCVPRNMTQAAGMYNTLMLADDPAVVIEVLNGYRLKEPMPDNVATLRVPLGVPEVIRYGDDLTLVTYGACCRLALEAAEVLFSMGVSIEVIDVQTLLPFDQPGIIGQSVRKTSRVLFLDEDVPGGGTAYMLQQVLEGQHLFYHLDAPPRTLSARAHRPAYGSDGDYFSKPNVEQIIDTCLELSSL